MDIQDSAVERFSLDLPITVGNSKRGRGHSWGSRIVEMMEDRERHHRWGDESREMMKKEGEERTIGERQRVLQEIGKGEGIRKPRRMASFDMNPSQTPKEADSRTAGGSLRC